MTKSSALSVIAAPVTVKSFTVTVKFSTSCGVRCPTAPQALLVEECEVRTHGTSDFGRWHIHSENKLSD